MKKLTVLFIILLITDIYVYKQYTNKRIQLTRESQVASIYTPEPSPTVAPETNTGFASWYDRRVCEERIYGVDCKTSNGEIFDDTKFTTACTNDIRLGSRIRVCHVDKCIEVVCTDRGNFERLGRKFDLSSGAFNSLANIDRGVIKVKFEVIQ